MTVTKTSDRPPTPVHKRGRTCVGCGAVDAPDALVRLVLDPSATQAPAASDAVAGDRDDRDLADGHAGGGRNAGEPGAEVAFDLAGGSFGRGAHVHPRASCLAKAAKSGLSRAFRCRVAVTSEALFENLRAAVSRRVSGLIVGAKRAGHLAIGADAACEALERGAPLVLVASDAGTVVGRAPIAHAAGGGRAVVWSDKRSLGALMQREEVAVVAVENDSVARELSRVVSMVDAARDSGRRAEARS
jgi:predicted RNA-binding protein YlxR (DUF448 family)